MIAEVTKRVKEYLSTKAGKRTALIVVGAILAGITYWLWKKYGNKPKFTAVR